jgi:hypothetical protein
MMIHRLAVLFVLTIILISCEKEEIPIQPFDRGGNVMGTVDMGQGYVNQVYFSLFENQIAGIYQKVDWDIALKNGEDSRQILLNGARFMSAWQSDFTTIESADDSSGYGVNHRPQIAETMYSDPVLGDLSGIYLIDLGFNEIGLPQGMYWLEVPEVDSETYMIKYKKYGQEEIIEREISKSNVGNYRLYSFLNDEAMDEPSEETWDLKFTQYTYQFVDPPIAYLVVGLTLNPYRTVAAEYSEKEYDQISAADTAMVEWTDQPDVIGYDWKTYSFETATYIVNSERTWLIRNARGFYYKLRFIGFYDENGNVGVPNFEFRLL